MKDKFDHSISISIVSLMIGIGISIGLVVGGLMLEGDEWVTLDDNLDAFFVLSKVWSCPAAIYIIYGNNVSFLC